MGRQKIEDPDKRIIARGVGLSAGDWAIFDRLSKAKKKETHIYVREVLVKHIKKEYERCVHY